MLSAIVLTYVEAIIQRQACMIRPDELDANDGLAFVTFVRDFDRWRKERPVN